MTTKENKGEKGEKDEKAIDLPPEEVSESDKLLLEKGYTAEDLAGLSDTEKSGLLLGDKDTEQPEGEAAIPDESLEKIAEEEGGEKPKGEEPPPEKPPAEPPEKPSETPPEVTDEQLLAYRPAVQDSELPTAEIPVPDEFQKQLKELRQKRDEGDIDADEYEEQRDKVNRKIYANEQRVISQARDAKQWEKEQQFFLKSRPEYIAKDIKGDALYGALNKRVQAISSDEKNAHLTGMQILMQADREVKAAFGISTPKKETQAVKPGEKPAEPLPDNVTLADIPAAGKNGVGDPFADLDKLTGEAYEEALERLPENVRRAYLDRA